MAQRFNGATIVPKRRRGSESARASQPSHRAAATAATTTSAALVATRALPLHRVAGAGMIDRADDGIGAGREGRCDDQHQGEAAHRVRLDVPAARVTTQERDRAARPRRYIGVWDR
jgi:hypothetical protein